MDTEWTRTYREEYRDSIRHGKREFGGYTQAEDHITHFSGLKRTTIFLNEQLEPSYR
jgi:hypothetical protein